MVRVLACKGCGSAIAEAFLTLAGVPYKREEVNYSDPGPGRDELLRYNPLGQVPTLIFENGEVLTETLALAHELGLQPATQRRRFLRWSTFLVAAVYPTFTYGDDPSRWVPEKEGARLLRESTDAHRKALWQVMEKECGTPYFLGEEFSPIDIYIGAMTHWRPGVQWFADNTPKLSRVAEGVSSHPQLQKVWPENFG